MLKLITGLILLTIVLLFAQWWLQKEGFRVSKDQAKCEKAFQTCMKKAVTADDAKLCNSIYTNCMGTPIDASGSTVPTYSGGIYGRDASGNRVLLVNPKEFEDNEEKGKYSLVKYDALKDAALKGTKITNPQLGPQLGTGNTTLVGYNQLGLYPTQANLDAAQGKNFVEEDIDTGDKKGRSKGKRTTTTNDEEDDSTAPITTTIPPAGMTDSVKEQIRRDTVQAVRDELKKLFANNEYLYKVED